MKVKAGNKMLMTKYVVDRFDHVCHQHHLSPTLPQKPSTFASISMPKPIFLISCLVSIPRLNSRLVFNFSSSDFSILTGEERQGPGLLRILSQINGNFSSHFVNLKDGLSFQFKSFKRLSLYRVNIQCIYLCLLSSQT